ncbi:MAG: hypothetical protein JSS81_26850 [Acidobacteria bacterium]|nr:hypothetical protein [Acidobacteriota bacterium]
MPDTNYEELNTIKRTARAACFTGETLVNINESYLIHFEALYERRLHFVGTTIQSFDDEGRIVVDVIDDVSRHLVHEYLKVSFEDGSWLNVTPAHPFFSEGREFVPIGELGEGARVLEYRDEDWRWLTILAIEPIEAPEGIEVFNLRTSLTRHYFVEHKGVHNLKARAAKKSERSLSAR